MPCYLLFRRGNWLYRVVAPMVPASVTGSGSILQSLTSTLTRDSWMSCALLFTMKCTATPTTKCPLCEATKKKEKRPYHLLTIRVDEDLDGLLTTIDEPYEKLDAWLFLLLPAIEEVTAFKFWRECNAIDCPYNGEGLRANFLPAWMRCCRAPQGIGADNDYRHARSFFCSELFAAFVQAHKYPGLGLMPCTTTPQQLLDALLLHYPSLRDNQFALRVGAKPQAKIRDMLENFKAV